MRFYNVDYNEKAKRTVSDHPQPYQKFCRVVSPQHVVHLVEDDEGLATPRVAQKSSKRTTTSIWKSGLGGDSMKNRKGSKNRQSYSNVKALRLQTSDAAPITPVKNQIKERLAGKRYIRGMLGGPAATPSAASSKGSKMF